MNHEIVTFGESSLTKLAVQVNFGAPTATPTPVETFCSGGCCRCRGHHGKHFRKNLLACHKNSDLFSVSYVVPHLGRFFTS